MSNMSGHSTAPEATRSRFLTILIALLLSIGSGEASLGQEREWGVDRSITQVSEHVYRWGSDGQYGAYILTTEGIIVVDGHYCPSGTVDWLKSELAARHNVPVKFVVLSHDHQDHICNSGIFNDTAVAIGHRRILPHIIREQRNSAVPQLTFEDSMEINLGELEIKLLYFGPSHSDNLIHVHVPSDNVLISIDVARDSLFPDLRDMEVHGMLDNYEQLARLPNAGIVLPGHGPNLLDQGSFSRMRGFLVALEDRVLDAMIAGRSLPEIRASVRMDDFSDIGGMTRSLDSNIVSMYDYLYRYREPNVRIEPAEAVACIENSRDCRTANP